MDGHVCEHFLKGMQKLYGIAVPVDYPENNQFPPHLPQGFLHDVAVTGRAGLGAGGGIDDHGMLRVALHSVQQVGPSIGIVQTVQTAKQIRQDKLLVRLEDIRVVSIGIHKQNVRVSVEQIVHEGEGKEALADAALAAADIEHAVLNVHDQSSVSGLSGV